MQENKYRIEREWIAQRLSACQSFESVLEEVSESVEHPDDTGAGVRLPYGVKPMSGTAQWKRA